MSNKRVAIIFGTRPELIKLAPLIHQLKKSAHILVNVINTGQHLELIQSVMQDFNIHVDLHLSVMKPQQDLSELTAELLIRLRNWFQEQPVDLVVVQGDTTTALTGALAASYFKIPVLHVEAGLRSLNLLEPFPEEMNRKLITVMARYHFAPTKRAVEYLLAEGVPQAQIFQVGNTAIDAIHYLIKHSNLANKSVVSGLDLNRKLVLITCHRRENFGEPLIRISEAVTQLAIQYPSIQFVYPVHPNPNIRNQVSKIMVADNIYLIEPLSYADFVKLMSVASLILTDSGGVQEEATVLNVPLLILRNQTERQETVDMGLGQCVGTDVDHIVSSAKKILEGETLRQLPDTYPYGDGTAALKIAEKITEFLA